MCLLIKGKCKIMWREITNVESNGVDSWLLPFRKNSIYLLWKKKQELGCDDSLLVRRQATVG